MKKQEAHWFIFILLSLTWGSSFILMKLGMEALSIYQVASLRIVCAGLILLPITIRCISKIPRKKVGLIFISGTIGNLIPAFLFCAAESKVDSALAGTLNSLTPIFAIVTGLIFFQMNLSSRKLLGISIAFVGSLFLLFSKGISNNTDISYSLLIVFATLLYGINVNFINRFLHEIESLHIAAIGLSLCAIPAFIILYFTGYFQVFTQSQTFTSTLATFTLGVVGTAIANILFYKLIKEAGVVFSSMVTYGMPFVALGWGLVFKENIGWLQVVSLFIILIGVYIAGKKTSTPQLQTT